MPIFYLVRHGSVAAPADPDPELDARGWQQARVTAQELAARLPQPLSLLSSPLRRCRQTAAPLAALWQARLEIEPAAIEFPSPLFAELSRGHWLQQTLNGSWDAAAQAGEAWEAGYAARLNRWRQGLPDALLSRGEDCVVFTHFVVINSLHGLAGGGELLSGLRPDNGSVTVFAAAGRGLRLIEAGRQKAGDVV